ncbi:MAG: hypothetical protein JWO00_538 [Candidatus Parcubacteria bacterium]|nr:hypothetical protein [Candidatus Parcubacteria bacterium]
MQTWPISLSLLIGLIFLERMMNWQSEQMRKIKLEEQLEENWKQARIARETWEREYRNSYGLFRYKEYHRLWQEEIEAESLLLHHVTRPRLTTSWIEYWGRKEKSKYTA